MKKEDFISLLPELVANYKPQDAVLDKIAKIELLMIIGPSAVGKTTLINRLGMPYVPSDTTRASREGEVEGKDFYFLDDYDQVVADIQAGKFVQVAIGSAGDFFATRSSYYPPKGIAVMAVLADAVPVFRQLGFAKTISAFIVRADFAAWLKDLKQREAEAKKLQKRIAEAKRSFKFALNDSSTHFILNDKIEGALTQLKELVAGKANRQREAEAKRIAQEINLKLLNL